MQYMLMFRETASDLAQREDPERAPAYWGAWSAYVAAVREAGIIVNGDGLQAPSTSTTVRLRDGKRLLQDGPYADTKEFLGGYFVVEVDGLDQALEWAARSPNATTGSTEVRPVLPPMGAG